MPFIVVYDANVLYPSTLRDLLIRIGQAGLVQAKWTDAILDEVFHNLRANRPDLSSEALERTRDLMGRSVRDCLVIGYGRLIDSLQGWQWATVEGTTELAGPDDPRPPGWTLTASACR
jgi:hypothetical protein